jgi:hypothetical protein
MQLEAAHQLQETAKLLMQTAEQEEEQDTEQEVLEPPTKVSKTSLGGPPIKSSKGIEADKSVQYVKKRGSANVQLRVYAAQGKYPPPGDIMDLFPDVWPPRLAPMYLAADQKRQSHCPVANCNALPRGAALYTVWGHIATSHTMTAALCPLCPTSTFTNPQSMRKHLAEKHK